MKPILGFLLIICLVGCEGPMGPAGDPGPAGRDGLDGNQGEKGEQGWKGDQGEKGDQGPPGQGGTSYLTYVSRFNNEDEISTWIKQDIGAWRIEEGRLILSGTGDGNLMDIRPTTNFTSDLDISFDTEWLGGIANHSYGILFRLSSKGVYVFGISGNGQYIVAEYGEDRNKPENLIAWTASSVINIEGKNKLRVVTSGSFMEFYINGTMVNSITDDSLTEGEIGLYIQDIQEVAFDNLVVKIIGMDGQPLLKPLSE